MLEKSTGFRPNLLVKILKSTGQTCQICHMYADVYSGHPIYSLLQGIQLELQSGRTRSDSNDGSASCSGIDPSMHLTWSIRSCPT